MHLCTTFGCTVTNLIEAKRPIMWTVRLGRSLVPMLQIHKLSVQMISFTAKKLCCSNCVPHFFSRARIPLTTPYHCWPIPPCDILNFTSKYSFLCIYAFSMQWSNKLTWYASLAESLRVVLFLHWRCNFIEEKEWNNTSIWI